MALPIVKTAYECADIGKTVLPYISQLNDLPSRLVATGGDLDSLKDIYVNTNPLVTAVAFMLFTVPIFIILSEITRNYSQVDRSWSILPTIYNAHYSAWAHLAGVETERLNTVLMFSIIWSIRLTFNFFRKGGYSIGSEDYRWAILRTKITSPALWLLFNVVFISFAQSVLLLLITTPTYILLLLSTLPEPLKFNLPDMLFSRALIVFIFVELFADQQQWKFQKAKKAYQANGSIPEEYEKEFTKEDLDRGFVVVGLWSWSRHPNFLAEQAIWFTLYQWACYQTDTFFNWTGVGAISYMLLFQASTWFTELVSAGKYPEYKEYQARVGKFIPRWSLDPKEQ
ncbi:hypothetical protein FQN54_003573 [Arachnomyces sp. PD_36]|nr:hypothetical protein FQN54_003573 [Arachnomyces sp. PD_36]